MKKYLVSRLNVKCQTVIINKNCNLRKCDKKHVFMNLHANGVSNYLEFDRILMCP